MSAPAKHDEKHDAHAHAAAPAAATPASAPPVHVPSKLPDKIVAMGFLAEKAPCVRYEYPPKPMALHDVDFYVTYNGVCATDMHMIDNDWKMSRYPLVPGHEVIGRVIAVGAGVKDFKVGDVVGLGCLAQKCDKPTCGQCSKGRDNLCPERAFTYFGNTKDETGEHVHHGGFSSFIRTDEKGLFKIPAGYSEAHAGPLMCAGITVSAPMYEFCNNSFDGRGKKIGILGIGGLGHLAVKFAAKMGFDKVTAISRTEDKLPLAMSCGATHYISSGSEEQMKAAAGSLDMLLVCQSGGSFDVDRFLPLLAPYGHLHFVGVLDGPVKVNLMPMVFSRLTISASPIGSGGQMRAMLEFAAKHDIKPIIEVFPHSKADEALAKVRDSSIRFRAVLKNDLA